MGSYDLWDAWQDRIIEDNHFRRQIDTKNQRIAAVLTPPGPIGPFHPAHCHIRHPAETSLLATSSPLLRLPTELHLQIFSYIRADEDGHSKEGGVPHAWLWTVLALRGASRFYRHMLPPLTHSEILDLEITLRATTRRIQACRYCLCLRHVDHFSQAQIRHRGVPIDAVLAWAGYSVKSYENRMKRFCLDCGFAKAVDPEVDVGKGRYSKGTEVVVGEGERWVWCWWCGELKKGDEAGRLGVEACGGSCAACCAQYGCRGTCVRAEQDRRRIAAEEWIVERQGLELD